MHSPLSFITVGKVHNNCRSLTQFGLRRGDKLIDDNLGTIGKISKLCFPDNQSIQFSSRIPKLKTESRKLTKMAVIGEEFALILIEVVQGNKSLICFRSMKNSMPVGECTSFNILSCQTKGCSPLQQRAESKPFSKAPVNGCLILFNNLCPSGELSEQLGVRIKILRNCVDFNGDLFQLVNGEGCIWIVRLLTL